MSRYLVGRIEAHPKITVTTGARVSALPGQRQLEAVTVHDGDGHRRTIPAAGLLCSIGASPSATFLDGVARDDHGFVRTDRDLGAGHRDVAWDLLGRPPLPYQTSVPGLLAAGDVRSGSVKRVAAAVGEGAAAVSAIHTALASSGRR